MWPFKEIAEAVAGKKVAAGGSLGGKPKPFQLAPKLPAMHETWADRIDWACIQYDAKYEIRRDATQVTVRLILEDGDTVYSGKGETTAAAVERVIRKVQAGQNE